MILFGPGFLLMCGIGKAVPEAILDTEEEEAEAEEIYTLRRSQLPESP